MLPSPSLTPRLLALHVPMSFSIACCSTALSSSELSGSPCSDPRHSLNSSLSVSVMATAVCPPYTFCKSFVVWFIDRLVSECLPETDMFN